MKRGWEEQGAPGLAKRPIPMGGGAPSNLANPAPYASSSYSVPPSGFAAGPSTQAPNMPYVDLTSNNDDPAVEEYGDHYFGQLQSKIVGVQYYQGVVSRYENVILKREPENRYDRNAIQVKNISDVQVGHIPREVAQHLAPLLDQLPPNHFRVEGIVPGGVDNKYSIPLVLHFRGSEREAPRIQAVMQRLKTYFRGNFTPPQPIAQPQPTTVAKTAVAPKAYTVQEIMERQLEKLYQADTSYEAMPEADTPARLRSQLHQHQRKALHWMLRCERDIDVAQAIAEKEAELSAAGMGAASSSAQGASKKKAGTSASVFFFEKRKKPTDGRDIYYNLATDSATYEPPKLARGGILADDMGLGKTITALGLIASELPPLDAPEALPGNPKKPTLIVAPLSVLSNWEDQIREHIHGDVRVSVFHGSDRKLDRQADIVLTTYQILQTEAKYLTDDGRIKGRYGLLHMQWRRVILDEAHVIKNRASQTAKVCFALEADSRWCLTGTPIVNKIDDLFSLVKFLRIEPFCKFDWFNRIILRPIKDQQLVGFERLQLLVRFHTLRRLKDQKVKNPDGSLRSLVLLPPKVVKVLPVELDEADRKAYDALYMCARRVFASMIVDKERTGNYNHILTMLLRLRLLCCHASLVPKELLDLVLNIYKSHEDADMNHGAAALEKALRELGKEGLEKFLEALKEKSVDDECSICLDLSADVITRCGHVFHRACIENHLSTQARLSGTPNAPCPNCRQPISLAELMDGGMALPPQGDNDKQAEEGAAATDEGQGLVMSAKLRALMEHVKEVQGRSSMEGNKLVIFSQFTSFLDLAQRGLIDAGVNFVRLDGSVSREKRAQAIRTFNSEDSAVNVFLISLKAGGLGLNLTAASNVVLCDPWWNGSSEDQAIDRIHRMGQTRSVEVVRLICHNTVEESLLKVQANKRQMVDASFHKSREDLRNLNLQMLTSVFEL